MKSAPAIHARESGHTMDWNSTSMIISPSSSCPSLSLLEQAAIHTFQPAINRTDKVPTVNLQWTHLLPRFTDNQLNFSTAKSLFILNCKKTPVHLHGTREGDFLPIHQNPVETVIPSLPRIPKQTS
eukprot:sb/3475603/